MKRLPILITAAAALAAGCAKSYVRVDLEYAGAHGDRAQPAVSTTPSYRRAARDIQVVAVRMPEFCVTESAAQATGRARSTDLIMESTCAVWLAELERALVGGGYRVISWDSLYELERTRNLSTYVAARELGAHAVVLVNSLEATVRTADQEGALTIRYYQSNPSGEAVAPVNLPASTRSVLKRLMDRARLNAGGGMLSAALDATVVLTVSGEAAWFYRWDITQSAAFAGLRAYLFRGRGRHFRPVRPRDLDGGGPSLDESAAVETASGHAPGAVDPYKRGKLELVRTVARDFATRLRQGDAP